MFVTFAVAVVKEKFGYDDSLDAFGVHGIGGTWGAVATGLWCSTEINPAGADGLFYGSADTLIAQLIFYSSSLCTCYCRFLYLI